jgi:DNA-binding NtrC family response regulator
MADNHLIQLGDLPGEMITLHAPTSMIAPPELPAATMPHASPDDLRSIERAHVLEVLRREQGNKARAARALGITRRSLYRLLDKYSIRDGTAPNGAGTGQSAARKEPPSLSST